MQTDTPKQGPTYFPMDRVSASGDDPVFLLNRQNANPSSNSNYNNSSNSFGNPNSATGDPNAGKKKSTRLARILAVLVVIVSIIMFIAGVVNIIFASKLIGYLTDDTKPFSTLRSPTIFVWIWVTPGVWASIPPFLAGLTLLLSRRTPKKLNSSDYNPGLPIELQNSQANSSVIPDAYRVFSIFSITFTLPLAVIFAILDVLISLGATEIIKVILPIIVAIAAVVDFVLLLVAWYGVKDANDNEYQYIGSTYTIYETYEPLLGKQPPVMNTTYSPAMVTSQCCPKDNSSPIVIINQPPGVQPIAPPINVLVEDQRPPPRRIIPRPRPLPQPMPVPVPVPVPVPALPRPISVFNQQRYYPNQMYGPPPTGILGRPNAYSGMFLPAPTSGASAYGQFGRL